MVDYLKFIDFSKEDPRLQDHIKKVAAELAAQYKDDEEYKQPVKDIDVSNIVIVTGLPVVEEAKVDKLEGFLKAKFLPGAGLPAAGVELDIVSGKSTGFGLFTFADQDAAKNAVAILNGLKFDASHTINACTNDDFDEMVAMEDKYTAPTTIPRESLQEWLTDKRFREQLLVRVQNRHYLQWFDHVSREEQVFSGNTFAEFGEVIKTEWSKSGSYLITFHERGFALWGGKNFEKLNFYPHLDVVNVEFSYDETYVLSFNGTVNEAPNSDNYIVWRVGSALKLRTFKASQYDTWGCYKWSYDSQYLASFGNGLLNIYELPSMLRIVDPQTQKRNARKVPDIQAIEWKPNKNLLCVAAYKTQTGKTDAQSQGKIYLIEVPTLQVIKWKTITWEFNNCEIFWEATGNKVILALKKVVKNKKSIVVQIGDIRHNSVTVEEKEFPDGKVVNVDETGRRLAVCSRDMNQKDAQLLGFNIDFFRTDEEHNGKYFHKLGTLADRPCSHVLWSSNGVFYAIVNSDPLSAKVGFLEFGFIKNNTLETFKTTKIPYMNRVAWDNSGRYLFTSSAKGQYQIWTGFGEAILKDTFNEITQIEWRPKPRTIFNKETEAQVQENFKKSAKRFEEDDDRILNEDKYKKEERRKKQLEEFEQYMAKKKKQWEATKNARIALLGFDQDNMPDLATDELIEGEEPLDTRK